MATTAWESETGEIGIASLPTPNETPLRTPSRSSGRSRRSRTPSRTCSKSMSPSPRRGKTSESRTPLRDDDKISVLDPRRFTPTLHANLVSEILTLRRDQEDKTKAIESLESSLHATREEAARVAATLTLTSKEGRSLRRQLALLEGGTSSALTELARERDEAVDVLAETRKRLESVQKRARTLEEDSERVHKQWAQEKEDWTEARWKLQRKLAITETRLKTVLDKVVELQAQHEHEAESPVDEAASTRTLSLTDSIRYSTNVPKLDGTSLADELHVDGDGDGDGDDDDDESDSDGLRDSTGHARNVSRDSLVRSQRKRTSEMLVRRRDTAKINYIDTATQYSPSPPTSRRCSVARSGVEWQVQPRADEIEANQRRKRTHGQALALTIKPSNLGPMVHGSCQTAEEPPSPPRTPLTPEEATSMSVPAPAMKTAPCPVVSSSTQTTTTTATTQTASGDSTYPIPSISVVPPTSRPNTPREPRLPQQFKDQGCQVVLVAASRTTESVATQTDEVRCEESLEPFPECPGPMVVPPRNPRRLTDERRPDLPSPAASIFAGVTRASRATRVARAASAVSVTSATSVANVANATRHVYAGNNDDGPLSGSEKAPMRRPRRISSLFAGFDDGSSDEDEQDEQDDQDDLVPAALDESDFHTALSPRPKTGSGASKVLPPIRHNPVAVPVAVPRIPPVETRALADAFPRFPRPPGSGPGPGHGHGHGSGHAFILGSAPPRPAKSDGMRKAAIVQNGISQHVTASHVTADAEVAEPPFPIPVRASSRLSSVAGADGSPRPDRNRDRDRDRFRDAPVIGRPPRQRYRRQNPTPRPQATSSASPASPASLVAFSPVAASPVAASSVAASSVAVSPTSPVGLAAAAAAAAPPPGRELRRLNPSLLSRSTATPEPTPSAPSAASASAGSRQAGVVDAIAQTMVGEWMFKYVRRRRSFGMSDARGDETSNDRHKRWVWLAPYERAVLWSAKQPSSGSALMGKPGRKLTIHSVLDVKDDNPPPKSAGPLFNRSILILTPQRALKFTATNAARHYVWLTALTFLAHSDGTVPELVSSPTLASPSDAQARSPKVKRAGLRQSIRGATKPRSGPPSTPLSSPRSPPEDADARTRKPSAATPPIVPRISKRTLREDDGPGPAHARRRSNTGGHTVPTAATLTRRTHGDDDDDDDGDDHHHHHHHKAMVLPWTTTRPSEASTRPESNFFDAIGTIRMEAFISPLTQADDERGGLGIFTGF